MSTCTDVNEYTAVTAVVQKYLDGARSGKSEDMRPAFHEAATIFGYMGDSLFSGKIEALYDWHDANGPARSLKAEIERIDVVKTIATVRLRLDNWTGHDFTDMFTLLKTNGEWKIMNKVFHLHA